MKVIIVGVGRTGLTLLSSLSNEEYDIIIIDKDKKMVDSITDKYNVNGFVGSGASLETLKKAGAESADAIIALTPTDEINLLSCMQAKKLGTRYSCARIVSPDLVRESKDIKKQYRIDYLITPRLDVADEIYQNIGMPGFTKIEGFFGNMISVLDLNVLDNSPLKDKTLSEIGKSEGQKILISAVMRNNKLIIPKGDFTIKSGDNLTISIVQKDLQKTLEKLGAKRHKVSSIVIVGGGRVAEYFLEKIEHDPVHVTVLEIDKDRCSYLMERFPKCKIVYSGNDVIEAIKEAGIGNPDMFISLTDKDETNLVISMYAWSCKIPAIMTYVENPEHARLLHKVNIDITVSQTSSCALKCMRFLRYYESIDNDRLIGKFYMAADDNVEIIELPAEEGFPLANIRFMDPSFKIKSGVIISAIIREGEAILPSGAESIRDEDLVIVTASRKLKIRSLREILA